MERLIYVISKENIIFLSFTFTLTWVAHWFLVYLVQSGILGLNQPLSQFLIFVGGSAPTVGAYITILFTKKGESIEKFNLRLFKFKVSYKWYIFALVIPVILGVIGVFMAYLYNKQFFLGNPIKPIYLYIPGLFSSIIFGGIEELGWRGTLLPELQKKYNNIVSTIIVGAIWGIWHLPYFYLPGTSSFGNSVFLFILSAIGVSFFLTILYIKTESIFLCILFHASLNATGRISLSAPRNEILAYTTYVILIIFIGYLLLKNYSKKRLNY